MTCCYSRLCRREELEGGKQIVSEDDDRAGGVTESGNEADGYVQSEGGGDLQGSRKRSSGLGDKVSR